MRYQQVPFSFYVRQPGCTYLIRKSYFDKYWGMWNRDMSHDSFLWKVALFSNSLYSLNEPLIKWRRHSSNESNRRKIKKEDRVKEVKSNLEFICDAKKKFTGEYIEKAYKFCELREKMFDKNSLFFWVLIFINYRGFYVSLRSCFGDLYLLLGLGERL